MTSFANLVLMAWCILVGLVQMSSSERRFCGRALADTLDFVCEGRGFHLGKRNGRSVGTVFRKNQNRPNVASNSRNSDNSDIDAAASSTAQERRLGSKARPQEQVSGGILARHILGASNAGSLVNSLSSSSEHRDMGKSSFLAKFGKSENKLNSIRARARRNADSNSIVEECCLQACNFDTLMSYCARAEDEEDIVSMNDLRSRLGVNFEGVTSRPSRSTANPNANNPSAQINRGRASNQSNSFFYLQSGQEATRSPLIDQQNKRQS